VLRDDFAEIHPIQLIAGKDQNEIVRRSPKMDEVAPDCGRRALIPVRPRLRLLRGKNVDKTAAEGIEVIGALDMAVQRRRIELGENEDPVDIRVDAVADRDIDQTIFAGKWNRGLCNAPL